MISGVKTFHLFSGGYGRLGVPQSADYGGSNGTYYCRHDVGERNEEHAQVQRAAAGNTGWTGEIAGVGSVCAEGPFEGLAGPQDHHRNGGGRNSRLHERYREDVMPHGHTCIITKASRELIAEYTEGNLRNCDPLPDGNFAAWFDDDVWEYLNALSDNIDEAIKIICSNQFGSA